MSRMKVYGPVVLTIEDDHRTAQLCYPSDLPLPNRHVAAALAAARAAGMVEAVEFADCGDVMVTCLSATTVEAYL